ncbi:MAG TPA: ribosome biogenesis GTPase Der [Candidatus Binatia bacterium]|nr:ribosome biogenesis GTPase Der [Candidatus Binatia bacterium]
MRLPLVAIIGLPNSGKSTFFNKVLERRTALTHEEAGTTRDRAYGQTEWNGLGFYLVDTAGIIPRPNSPLEKNIQKQTAIAQEEADLIIMMVDGKTNPSTLDIDVARRLQKSKKPVILATNKIDVRNPKIVASASAYKKLGLGEPAMLSSVNGSGVGDLLDRITDALKKDFSGQKDEFKGYLRVAFLGKPNVGKSSLINKLLGEERLIVDSKAGTTRSTVEIPFERAGKKYVLIDTAGIKKKWKQDIDIEAAAMLQSLRTIGQIDVALFVVDATETITAQDQIIAQKIIEQDKPVVVLLNKIDKLSKEDQQKRLDILPHYFPQLWWAPVVFTSGMEGTGLELVLKFAYDVYNAANKELDTFEMDKFLEDMLKKHMPGKITDERAPKIYNLKQIAVRPPTFKLTVNFPRAIAPSWRKFFEKQFRLKFGLEGSPIIFKYAKKN